MKPDQLSYTAAYIAVKFYGLTRDQKYRSLFDEEVIRFYEQLVRQLPAPLNYYHNGLKYKPLRRFFTFWEELLLPGDLMHIILRKWYLTRWVAQLRNKGYKQMLVLGAGFDHLAALNAGADIYCVELDAPRMASLKRDFLKSSGYIHQQLDVNDTFLTQDSLQKTLYQTKLDPEKETIIVAEGFFDYFSRSDCSTYISALNEFFNNDTMLLSTLFSLEELAGFRAYVYRNSIRLSGEKLKLHLNKEAYLSLLEEHSFKTEQLISSDDMEEEVLKPKNITYPILEGFYLIKMLRRGIRS